MNATVEQRADTGVENPEDLPLGVVTEMLLSRRRRLLLDYLDSHPEATFSEVVEYVTREEVGLGYGTKERKRVYVALYQNHAPKLDDAGVIEFDVDATELRGPGPHFRQVVDALYRLRGEAEEDAKERDRPVPRWRSLRELITGGGNDDEKTGDG